MDNNKDYNLYALPIVIILLFNAIFMTEDLAIQYIEIAIAIITLIFVIIGPIWITPIFIKKSKIKEKHRKELVDIIFSPLLNIDLRKKNFSSYIEGLKQLEKKEEFRWGLQHLSKKFENYVTSSPGMNAGASNKPHVQLPTIESSIVF